MARFIARILLSLVPKPHRDFVLGDLLEEHAEVLLPERGAFVAGLWLVSQAARSAATFVLRPPPTTPGRGGPRWTVDARIALRRLRRHPLFAGLVVMTLSVGVGATTAVFGVVNWTLFRPIPGVVNAARLVSIDFRDADGEPANLSYPDLQELAEVVTDLEGMAGQTTIRVQVKADAVPPVEAVGAAVTPGFFRLVGARIERGQMALGDESAVTPRTVVLGSRLAARLFRRSHVAVGSTLRINGNEFDVVGVADEAFRGVGQVESVELWMSASAYGALRHHPDRTSMDLANRSALILSHAVGRLSPDGTISGAADQLRTAMTRLQSAHPAAPPSATTAGVVRSTAVRGRLRTQVLATTPALLWVAVIVLLIACGNVASLLLVRGAEQTREFAVRRALGARTSNLYVQQLTESFVVAGAATLLGLALAHVMSSLVWRGGLAPALWFTGYWTSGSASPPLDGRVALVAAGTSLLATASLGVVPATFSGFARAHAYAGSGAITGRGVAVAGSVLAVFQVALSLSLVTGTLLLGRSLQNLRSVPLGFEADGLRLYHIDPGPQGYSAPEAARFHANASAEMSRLTGVESAVATYGPMTGLIGRIRVTPTGSGKTGPGVDTWADWVDEDFFDVAGLPVLERQGSEDDLVSTPVDHPVLLSEDLAGRLFPSGSAVGRTLAVRSADGSTVMGTVTGVVGDLVRLNRRGKAEGMAYLPLVDSPVTGANLLVRSDMPGDTLDRYVAEVVAGLDSDMPVSPSEPMSRVVERGITSEASLGDMITFLAGLATALAGVGVFSVIAYAMRMRVREIAVRVALGAQPRRIVWIAFRSALMIVAAGTVLGMVFSVGLARVIQARLFGVPPLDPGSFSLAAITLFVVGVLAAATPAVTASRADLTKIMQAD